MSHKILIVDDSATIRAQLRSTLLPEGFDVIKNPPLNLPKSEVISRCNLTEKIKPLEEASFSVSIFKVNPKEVEDSLEDFFDTEEYGKEEMIDKDSKKCQDCSIVFLTSFRLQRHIKKFHGGVTPTMASSDTPISDDSKVNEMPRPYSCQLCQKRPHYKMSRKTKCYISASSRPIWLKFWLRAFY